MTSPRALLTAWNIQAKKQLGQNFLNDPNVARAIVDKAGICGDDVVLEIGPGLGAITIPAAAAASRVVAVDKDGRIIGLLRTELLAAGIDNVEIREADILRVDLESVSREAGRPLVVMGNLPYNISSQVIVQLIHARSRIDRAVLMLQKEMAQRICAGPGSKDYGRLSVMLGYCADTQVLMQVRAPLFFPAPKVDSTVVGIRFAGPPSCPADDEAFLFRVVKAAFGKRRKTLRNALSQSDLNLLPSTCEGLLTEAQIDPMQRAERLSVAEFVRLSNIIGKHRQSHATVPPPRRKTGFDRK
ncbi:MAG: 16S rRNA (adenine(1518)-N(6)/adenine(1519)-N(6))-dimethyltransferase RsmA [Desulfosarcina sp.]|nr:16S rRNA (adenine(1518)-N(6)/adenine(1519)-N(6))-dimethyltransferase RsmA [Desulfosarcina sp.]MBC2744796.1 16S rRNA (adenine(1518)-N(6)/adenine(1519)-N(6))-dimethyltransferase RsmA [Desulfosarcina sp.]MBC2767704.1 16S rRNA (adenine(1518)-N(6)/adenine(1519)-N(6))-dimethyltransferase RsmA [Desulfosarcina sp.]